MMPSLFLKRYVQSVWTIEAVSLEIARGVISDSSSAGMAVQLLFSRIVTTCAGCHIVSREYVDCGL